MLTPELSACVLLAMFVLLLIIVPILEGSLKFEKFISLRYILTAVVLIMALGCILDFSHLAESSRNIVLGGGIGIVSLFIILRSLEKVKFGGKKVELSAQKGDVKVNMSLTGDPHKEKTTSIEIKESEKKENVNEQIEEIITHLQNDDERGGE